MSETEDLGLILIRLIRLCLYGLLPHPAYKHAFRNTIHFKVLMLVAETKVNTFKMHSTVD